MRTPRRTPTADAEPSARLPVRGRRAHAGPPADVRPDLDAAVSGPSPRAGRWHIRPRTVRAKIVCLLMVPVVSLLALWAYATVSTAQDVSRLRQSQRVDASVRSPVAAAVAALQAERTAAVRLATAPAPGRESDLKERAERTEQAVAELRLGDRHTVADGADLPTGVAERLNPFVTGAEQLRALRAALLDGGSGWRPVYTQYTATIATAFGVGGALTGIQRRLMPCRAHRRYGRHRSGRVRDGTLGEACRRTSAHAAARRR